MKKPVIILGSGGHSKVLVNILKKQGTEILGYVGPVEDSANHDYSFKYLGNDKIIYDYSPDKIELVNGLGALPGKLERWSLDNVLSQDYTFSTIVDDSSIVARDVILDEGVQVMAGSIIQPGTNIGRSTIINTKSSIDHDCIIGKECHIAPGVTISGGVQIGEGVHIGTGTSIIQSIKIANNVIIGAGSVIYKDIKENCRLITIQEQRIETINPQ
tara:strand:+ start:3372 stop:4016 length:645 start_codon:yes stop_codon:yes gene_type:complete